MTSTALISSPWHRHILQGRPLKRSDVMVTTLIVARHPFFSYRPSCLLFPSMLFGCLCVSDVTAPSRFTNLAVSNSTVVSQNCSSSQGLRILKPVRRAVSCQARWMASAEMSSAQYDARINQEPADCVEFARLHLYGASPNISHSGLDCELVFSSVRL